MEQLKVLAEVKTGDGAWVLVKMPYDKEAYAFGTDRDLKEQSFPIDQMSSKEVLIETMTRRKKMCEDYAKKWEAVKASKQDGEKWQPLIDNEKIEAKALDIFVEMLKIA